MFLENFLENNQFMVYYIDTKGELTIYTLIVSSFAFWGGLSWHNILIMLI